MVHRLLLQEDAQVVVYDNFSSGRSWHLPESARLRVIHQDLKDLPALTTAISGCDVVFHFASNVFAYYFHSLSDQHNILHLILL